MGKLARPKETTVAFENIHFYKSNIGKEASESKLSYYKCKIHLTYSLSGKSQFVWWLRCWLRKQEVVSFSLALGMKNRLSGWASHSKSNSLYRIIIVDKIGRERNIRHVRCFLSYL